MIVKRVHRQMKNIGDDYENKNYENKFEYQLRKIWKYLCDAKIEKGSRLDNLERERMSEQNEKKRIENKKEEKQRKRVEQDKHISDIKWTGINEKITYVENLCAYRILVKMIKFWNLKVI